MFVAHQLVIDISSQAAQARLANLAYGYGLSDASQQAHEDGLASLIRVGPLGDLPGASKLVRVRFLDPVYCDDAMTLGLRWKRQVSPARCSQCSTRTSHSPPPGSTRHGSRCAGAYRPPLGPLGAALDKAILNQMAAATIRALLRNVANALANPGPPHTAIRHCERAPHHG